MTIYTFPNIATLEQRGSLQTRYQVMTRLNEKLGQPVFEIVEVPGDFIKNATEQAKTGLELGAMLLTKEQVRQLYSRGATGNKNIKYILHTEPQLSRSGIGKRKVTPHLKWYDPGWFENFLNHVFNIIDYLEHLPYAIEIHPGTGQKGYNTPASFAQAVNKLHNRFLTRYGEDVLIFIENRTGQVLKSGTDMRKFWEYLKENFPYLTKVCGYVLDIQQLYTVTRENFTSELQQIPPESLRGCHIHTKHRVPYIEDSINWTQVAKKLHDTAHDLHVLPEVHHVTIHPQWRKESGFFLPKMASMLHNDCQKAVEFVATIKYTERYGGKSGRGKPIGSHSQFPSSYNFRQYNHNGLANRCPDISI